jgi:cytidylate kinase
MKLEHVPFVVAIDGPAGAGKSTVARKLADHLGFAFLDTGALYRTVAWLAESSGIAWTDAPSLAKLAVSLDIVFQKNGTQNRVVANGVDVTTEIRRPAISSGASQVSALSEVRHALLDLQRKVSLSQSVVAEGRDVGTVVFPQAQAKFFLTANLETRARRRTEEIRATGKEVDFKEVMDEMRTRDERDSKRNVAPLQKAEDALEIDTSDQTPDTLVEQMAFVVRQRGG